ncbi:MAG: hypothetical protein O7B25_07035 [Gammaproteobacteria bacterium]|nr:hypothetical protein [Gammaproteobacteria bacterium]
MSIITADTSIEELAAIVSQALEAAGITATLSGGGAVSVYTENLYLSKDLDFVTAAAHKALRDVVAPLGFTESGNARQFENPDTKWLVEFPPSPLGFGDMYLDHDDIPVLETKHGPLRIITPTLSVIDRLAAYWYHTDRQCWDQAIMVARSQDVDWNAVYAWASDEGRNREDIERLRTKAGR